MFFHFNEVRMPLLCIDFASISIILTMWMLFEMSNVTSILIATFRTLKATVNNVSTFTYGF